MRGEYFIRSASFRPNHVEYLHVLNDMRVDGALEAVAVATVLLGSAALHTQRVAACAGAVGAGSFACCVCLGERRLNGLVLRREEDDLGVGGLGHGLHGFQVADLHGWCR